MKNIIIILICLSSFAHMSAKDYTFKTKLYGDWILNDITNTVTFRDKSYTVVQVDQKNTSFVVSCIYLSDKRLFEIYTTETNIYLVEYEDQADVNVKTYIERVRQEATKEATKPSISHERFGNLDIDEMIEVLVQNPDYFYGLTGASTKYRQQILERTMEILQMSKQFKVSISMNGTYSFANPNGVNDKYKSSGEFSQKGMLGLGGTKMDNNAINNLAFFTIGKVAMEIYNRYGADRAYLKEVETRLKIAEIEKSQEADIEAWKRGSLTNIKWIQVLKTEIIE